MSAWLTPRRTLALGAALVIVVNAIVLAGVAWNRAGEPGSALVLTARELDYPAWQYREAEDSSLAMSIAFQTLTGRGGARGGYGGNDEGIAWLDDAKLASLGFDVSPSRLESDDFLRRPAEERECLLVLEFAGPAWREAVARARAELARVEATSFEDDEERQQALRTATESLDQLEHRATRLFVVDAGLDAGVLREKYPDRARYAIVGGLVALSLDTSRKQRRFTGWISDLAVPSLNIPRQWHAVVAQWRAADPDGSAAEQLAFDVAWGRRFEPWVRDVSTAPRAADAAAPAQTRE